MKIIIVFISILLSFSSHSQNSKLMNSVENDLNSTSLENFLKNCYSFIGTDFDSTDIDVFINNPIIFTRFPSSILFQSEIDSLTYQAIYDNLKTYKNSTFYQDLKSNRILFNQLLKKNVYLSHWDNDKKVLKSNGILELDLLQNFIVNKSLEGSNYKSVLDQFIEYKKTIIPKERKEIEKIVDTTFVFFDESNWILKSKEIKKPILIYFTGYGCVNCRKIEQMILFKDEIAEKIMTNFILIPLYVDDKTPLKTEFQKQVEFDGKQKKLMTISDANIYYEYSRFKKQSQPLFIVLNSKNELLNSTDYEKNGNSLDAFMLFLNQSLEKFGN